MNCHSHAAALLAAALLLGAEGSGVRQAENADAPKAEQTDPLVLRPPRDKLAIQGIWNVLWSEASGRKAPDTAVKNLKFFFSVDRLVMRMEDKTLSEATYTLIPNENPKAIDLRTQGRTALGIYDLAGDDLRLCLSESKQGRPAKFISEPDSVNDVLIALKREDAETQIANIPNIQQAVNRRVREELKSTMEVEFVDCPLEVVARTLGDMHAVKFTFDEERLEAAGLRRDVAVTFAASGVRLHTALVMVLKPLEMTYEVRDGAIVLTALEEESAVEGEEVAAVAASPERTSAKAEPVQPLFVINADGNGLRVLVSLPEFTSIGSPDWSQDGAKIAFDAWRSGVGETYVDAHVFVVDADGSSLRDLGPGAMPSWSPKGRRMTFCQYSPNHGVWIMNADGSRRELLDAEGWGSEWSPTGREIAYARHDGGANICLHDLIEHHRRTLLDRPYAVIYQGFEWSPDGNWICFKGLRSAEKWEIAVVHAEGEKKGFRVLLPREEGPEVKNVLPTISWGGDGRQILVSMKTEADANRQLYLLDPDGEAAPRLLPGQDSARINGDMAWSFDGEKIVFSGRAGVKGAR